jgi:hypothetical protein
MARVDGEQKINHGVSRIASASRGLSRPKNISCTRRGGREIAAARHDLPQALPFSLRSQVATSRWRPPFLHFEALAVIAEQNVASFVISASPIKPS